MRHIDLDKDQKSRDKSCLKDCNFNSGSSLMQSHSIAAFHFAGQRDYDLEIEVGELYEVWLEHKWEEPRSCIALAEDVVDGISFFWSVLVDSEIRLINPRKIFSPGTATRPSAPLNFPHMRTQYSTLLLQDIVSVQPMTAPSGHIFTVNYNLGGSHKKSQYRATCRIPVKKVRKCRRQRARVLQAVKVRRS